MNVDFFAWSCWIIAQATNLWSALSSTDLRKSGSSSRSAVSSLPIAIFVRVFFSFFLLKPKETPVFLTILIVTKTSNSLPPTLVRRQRGMCVSCSLCIQISCCSKATDSRRSGLFADSDQTSIYSFLVFALDKSRIIWHCYVKLTLKRLIWHVSWNTEQIIARHQFCLFYTSSNNSFL